MEEFLIKLAEKARDETEIVEAEQRWHRIRHEFWTKVIDAMAGEVRPVSQYLGRDLKLAFRGNRRARYPFELPRNKELCERES